MTLLRKRKQRGTPLYRRKPMSRENADITLEYADNGPALSHVRKLFIEYQSSIGGDVCFQDFSEEVGSLPGAYSAPGGRLYLASRREEPAACAALRPLAQGCSEMKRLYVRGSHRGCGLGRLLAVQIIADARDIGYTRLVLDTLPSMQAAHSLYQSLGFQDIAPYYRNPVPGVRFLALDL